MAGNKYDLNVNREDSKESEALGKLWALIQNLHQQNISIRVAFAEREKYLREVNSRLTKKCCELGRESARKTQWLDKAHSLGFIKQ